MHISIISQIYNLLAIYSDIHLDVKRKEKRYKFAWVLQNYP